MFHISQTTTVSDYVDRFTDLVEQLTAYTPNPDPLAHTTRFIDDLRDDIRRVVLVARPSNLDTACTLALLQEEVSEQGNHREYRTSENSLFPKTATIKGALPLPPPPPRPNHPPLAARPAEATKLATYVPPLDDRFTLRSYNKARGLCVRCGEKWAPGHKCSPVPQLHALQEIWDVCQAEFLDTDIAECSTTTEQPQIYLMLSFAAISGTQAPHTL